MFANGLKDVLGHMQHLAQRLGIEQPGRALQGMDRAETAD